MCTYTIHHNFQILFTEYFTTLTLNISNISIKVQKSIQFESQMKIDLKIELLILMSSLGSFTNLETTFLVKLSLFFYSYVL